MRKVIGKTVNLSAVSPTKRGDLLLNIKSYKAVLLLSIILFIIFSVPATIAAETVRVNSISINTLNLTLLWGEEEILTATLSPDNATDQRVLWENSNYAVLSLNAYGNNAYITAVGPGESVITAVSADGRYVARCTVTVIKPVTSIALGQDLVQLSPGETYRIEAWVEPRDASEQVIIWESSDNGVASVDADGLIKANSIGEARIIARTLEEDEISTYATVRVSTVPQTGVTSDQSEEPPFLPDDRSVNDPDSDGTNPNYLLYAVIAVLILAGGLVAFMLLRRSTRQPDHRPLSVPVSGASGRLPVLKGISGLYAGSKFALNTGPVTIGRDQSVARVVYPQEYEQISRRHLTIHFDPAAENFLIEDSSNNGTYLSNGSRLQPHQVLPPGETLTLANTAETFIVELE